MSGKTSRRKFIRRSAAIAAGAFVIPEIIPSTVLGMGGVKPPSDRVVIGAIGTGSQGMANMRDFLRLRDEVRFTALCDVDSVRLDNAKRVVDTANKSNDCRTYVDFREFLEKETLDAVSIALPDHWHGIIYTAAVNKKLHVYGEKPICRTISDGQAIVSAVRSNNIIWQTGSWQRSQANFHRGAELVANGRAGKITRIVVGLPDGGRSIGTPPVMDPPPELDWDMWLGPAPKVPYRGVSHWDWRWILDYSGGQLTDWAGHHIDIANWGAGLEHTGPEEISGSGVYPPEGIYDAPVEYDFLCRYANGIEMRVANASRLEHGMGTTWYGDLGWIHTDRGNVLTASDPEILKEVIGEDEIHLYKSENHWQNFIDSLRSGRQAVSPVDSAYRAISVALLGEIAMTTGETIKWDPDKEEIIGNPRASRLLSRPYRKPWSLPEA
ncbi:MAG TPA: Gfo/Idh/MocA family oxidoreductase [Bacteroidales bacterium]|jgi:predicted dehydrogenase|nr:Gfo/Idh/MocA family oxidoreductase [Bacteroidales bacterium]HQH25406.1 Gfo/Idh/MocA family oxidoreductase [Bacteroidales bacterium]HQJ83172.1 Gfo/Idh/MocA family oxidoreductase [Bacteroidales bacterium]